MYHITKTKSGKFMVVLIGKNGKVLSTTEELNSRRSCFNNIQAQLKIAKSFGFILVQDDTKRLVFELASEGSLILVSKTMCKPRYIPGKNTKQKKAK